MKSTTKVNILWRIYFGFLIINGIFVYLLGGVSTIWEIFDALISCIAFIGLFGYLFKKKIFSKLVWKIYFFVHLLWNIFYFYFIPLQERILDILQTSPSSMIIGTLIFYLPLFFALYIYAFEENK